MEKKREERQLFASRSSNTCSTLGVESRYVSPVKVRRPVRKSKENSEPPAPRRSESPSLRRSVSPAVKRANVHRRSVSSIAFSPAVSPNVPETARQQTGFSHRHLSKSVQNLLKGDLQQNIAAVHESPGAVGGTIAIAQALPLSANHEPEQESTSSMESELATLRRSREQWQMRAFSYAAEARRHRQAEKDLAVALNQVVELQAALIRSRTTHAEDRANFRRAAAQLRCALSAVQPAPPATQPSLMDEEAVNCASYEQSAVEACTPLAQKQAEARGGAGNADVASAWVTDSPDLASGRQGGADWPANTANALTASVKKSQRVHAIRKKYQVPGYGGSQQPRRRVLDFATVGAARLTGFVSRVVASCRSPRVNLHPHCRRHSGDGFEDDCLNKDDDGNRSLLPLLSYIKMGKQDRADEDNTSARCSLLSPQAENGSAYSAGIHSAQLVK